MPGDYSTENPSARDRAEEAGAAKLWSVYADEAERYDKSLVASWKSDMEGMLIFAGLFSASLTAFLIESYKTLVQDPGDATVQLLQQVLAVSSSNSTLAPHTSEPFKPTTSSLVCNALWFISLGLSLSCALVATLLEQWARDFLHRANMRSSPGQRARIYSYLYYGLRRFKMHAVVEIIPSLLHAALLFFFCGLVVFLVPVNKIIAALVAGILFLVVSFYVLLTILPLIHSDSPYRTPFSNAVWRMYQFCSQLLHQASNPVSIHIAETTLVDNMIEQAITLSDDRHKRDVSALLWTVDSLSDNDELQTFVEAIPDAMWGPSEPHCQNVTAMTALRDSAEVNVAFRIGQLWRSCDDGLLSNDAAERRRAACLKAFWALCTIPTPPSQFLTTPDLLPSILLHLPWYNQWSAAYNGSIYYVSSQAVVRWSGLMWLRKYLDQHLDSSMWVGAHRNLALVKVYVEEYYPFSPDIRQLAQNLQVSTNTQRQFATAFQKLCDSILYTILLEYLKTLAVAESPPYRWSETLQMIWPELQNQPTLQPSTNHDITYDNLSILWRVEAEINRACNLSAPGPLFHEAMVRLCFLWQPQQARCIPAGLISYIKYHGIEPDTLVPPTGSAFWNSQIYPLLKQTALCKYLWHCFSVTIMSANAAVQSPLLDDVLVALWVVANATIECGVNLAPLADSFDTVIQALAMCPAPNTTVVLLVVKGIRLWHDHTILPWSSRFCSVQVGVVIPVITNFLEECSIADMVEGQRAVAALRIVLKLGVLGMKLAPVDEAQQTRFTRGLVRVTKGFELGVEYIVRMVLDSTVFDPPDGIERFHWITEAAAQADMQFIQSLLISAGPQPINSTKDYRLLNNEVWL